MAFVLSINAGSSSVKVSVYVATKPGDAPTQLADAQIAGLTAPPCKLTYERGPERIIGQDVDGVESQEDAFEYILNHLTNDKGLSEISSRESITHACHRVVHGGDYPDAHIIDSETYHHLEDLTDLAPLHNASALAIVKLCMKALPNSKNIAYFDSSFHATIPKAISTYPIDPDVASKNKLRKYGFHGVSYAFITRSVADFLYKDPSQTNIIALHLGSGASACAIRNGKSVDNSMGLTPLDGLPGATRSGSVDPRSVLVIRMGSSLRIDQVMPISLIFHFTHDAGKPSPSSTKEMHISTVCYSFRRESILSKADQKRRPKRS